MMKKWMALFFSFVFCLALISCEQGKQRSQKKFKPKGVSKLLPANSIFMFKLNSLEKAYQYLSVTDDSVFGEKLDKIEKAKKDLGFNPLNINELKNQGIAVDKEIGFAITDLKFKKNFDQDPDISMLFFLPVTDGPKALAVMSKLIKKEDSSTKISKEANITIIENENDKIKIYLAEKDQYLFLAFDSKKDAKPLIENILAEKSQLIDSKYYQDVASRIDSTKELFCYGNINRFYEENPEAFKNFFNESYKEFGAPDMSKFAETLKDYEGLGLNVDLGASDLISKMVMNIKPSSQVLDLVKNVKFNKNTVLGLEDNMALLLSFGINIKEYYNMIIKMIGKEESKKIKTGIQDIKTEYGIDIVKDVIDNLDGNLNLAFYDGAKISANNTNTVCTVNVKNEAKAYEAIEKVIAKLPAPQKQTIKKEKINGTKSYLAIIDPKQPNNQLYLGVKNNNLIFTTGKSMYEKALNANAAKSFLTRLEDKNLVNTLKDDTNIVYLEFNEIYQVVKSFLGYILGPKGSDPKNQSSIGQFNYLLASSYIDNNSLMGDIIVKTKFKKPFLIAVKELIESYDDEKAPKK